MILFDIHTDTSGKRVIDLINEGLESVPGNPYLAANGPVGSPRWWVNFDRGILPVQVLTGVVVHVGPRQDDFGEAEDVIELDAEGQSIAFDRTDPWAAHPIRVGDRVRVTQTEVELLTPTGPVTYSFDVRGEWFPATRESPT